MKVASILIACSLLSCHGWKNSLRISYPVKEFSIFSRTDETFVSTPDRIPLPRIRYESMRAIDIGCGDGNSTMFLSKFIQDLYQPHYLDLLGLDSNVQNVYTASQQHPSIEFLYYDFFRYADNDIRPQSIDVIQTSLSNIQKNIPMNIRKLDFVLKKQGSLHLYGSLRDDIYWSSLGLQCDVRIPYHSNMEYLVVRQIHGNGFSEGIPSILSPISSY